MIILLKPEDGDESSDYSSANESFLDEDPKSSNDPDVLGLVAQGMDLGTWQVCTGNSKKVCFLYLSVFPAFLMGVCW